jgi:creatinine amidohydrolase/Fe(II)-dependent formamide hydrolase-like protein
VVLQVRYVLVLIHHGGAKYSYATARHTFKRTHDGLTIQWFIPVTTSALTSAHTVLRCRACKTTVGGAEGSQVG